MPCACHTPTVNAHKDYPVVLRRLSGDPTRTKLLREKFVREMNARFAVVRKSVIQALVKDDVLGLALNEALPNRAFAFMTDPEKADEFMAWLQGEMDNDILSLRSGPSRDVVGNARWTDTYIQPSYKRGMKRANDEMSKAGIDTGRTGDRWIDAAFRAPVHADRVGLLYTRTFGDLKGVTQAAATTMRRSLAEGIAEGRGPRQMARILLKRLDGIGKDIAMKDSVGRFVPALRRARMIARTEVIRAHHVATINTYREAGVIGVRVKAEWSTAGDDRVCAACADMEGKIFKLDEIEGMIPLHPNCRCVALPAEFLKSDLQKKGQARPLKDRLSKEIAAKAVSPYGAKPGTVNYAYDKLLQAGKTRAEIGEAMSAQFGKPAGIMKQRMNARLAALRKRGYTVSKNANGSYSITGGPTKVKIPKAKTPKTKVPKKPAADLFDKDRIPSTAKVSELKGGQGKVYKVSSGDKDYVYKPLSGEHAKASAGYPNNSMVREQAAAQVDEKLGWAQAPKSKIVKGPDGDGLLKEFIDGKSIDTGTWEVPAAVTREEKTKSALFNYIVGDNDAGPQNMLITKIGKAKNVDLGGAFVSQKDYYVINPFVSADGAKGSLLSKLTPAMRKSIKDLVADDDFHAALIKTGLKKAQVAEALTRAQAILDTDDLVKFWVHMDETGGDDLLAAAKAKLAKVKKSAKAKPSKVAAPKKPAMVSKQAPAEQLKSVKLDLISERGKRGISEDAFDSILKDLGEESRRMRDGFDGLADILKNAAQRKNGTLELDWVEHYAGSGNVGEYGMFTHKMRLAVENKVWKHGKVRIGEWTTGKSPFALYRHELGHHISSLSPIRDGVTMRREFQILLKGIGRNNSPELKAAISKYGSSNPGEAFAEAFSAWTSPEYSTAAKKLPEAVEEFMTKWIGAQP